MTSREIQNWLLTIAILGMAVTIGAREIRARRIAVDEAPAPPTYQADWRKALGAATLISNPQASVTLLEFVDLQCPFCRRSHIVVKELEAKFGNRLSVAFVHFPLSNHSKSRHRAFMVECGKRVDRGWEMIDQLFSLTAADVENTQHVASRAGVRDSAAFVQCLSDSLRLNRVTSGRAVGDSLGVYATPTIILNGWRFKGAVSKEYLGDAIDDLLAGRKLRATQGSRINAVGEK
ncbi:MAG: thioredoxin domain-containing protein [Gemmatimonadaceae bacterium]|nr:thioredoxin domain-containing protein [Gemmatimonadaceae bacterium]MCC6431333.1 thioredoxin domain-containing protein [Gemmatimonadaceae bacterium]